MESLDQYRGWVMDRLPCILDPTDFDCVFSCVEQCFNDGFTKEDTLKYLAFTEHVNKNVPEKMACQQMAAIAMKYPSWNNKPRKPITTVDQVIDDLQIQVIMLQDRKNNFPLESAERQDACGQITMANKAIKLLVDMIINRRLLTQPESLV